MYHRNKVLRSSQVQNLIIMQGKFIDFLLPFAQNNQIIPSKEQAIRIINEAVLILKNESVTAVAITYSANYDQTLHIRDCYTKGIWISHINGANQA